MNAIEVKFKNMSANDTFEVIAGIMKSEPTPESDTVLDFAMDALMVKVGNAEFARLMEQF